jgi:hypothetical protein
LHYSVDDPEVLTGFGLADSIDGFEGPHISALPPPEEVGTDPRVVCVASLPLAGGGIPDGISRVTMRGAGNSREWKDPSSGRWRPAAVKPGTNAPALRGSTMAKGFAARAVSRAVAVVSAAVGLVSGALNLAEGNYSEAALNGGDVAAVGVAATGPLGLGVNIAWTLGRAISCP